MEITNELVLKAVQDQFGEAVLAASEPYGMLTLEITKAEIKNVIKFLKDSEFDFMFLTDVTGIHFPDEPAKELGVIYHLYSMPNNFRVRLKVFMTRDDAVVDTITDLYAGANWMERETFDFFGIDFKGHPDMRVILNMEDLGYHPMLKEYELEDGTRIDKNDTMFGRGKDQ